MWQYKSELDLASPMFLCPLEDRLYGLSLIEFLRDLHIIRRLAMKECQKSKNFDWIQRLFNASIPRTLNSASSIAFVLSVIDPRFWYCITGFEIPIFYLNRLACFTGSSSELQNTVLMSFRASEFLVRLSTWFKLKEFNAQVTFVYFISQAEPAQSYSKNTFVAFDSH